MLLYLDTIIPNYTVFTNQTGDPNTLLNTILQDLCKMLQITVLLGVICET